MTTNRTEWVWAVSFLMLVTALVGLAVYTLRADRATEACIARVALTNVESAQARTAADDRKDRAELRRLEAMRHIVELRVTAPDAAPAPGAAAKAFAFARAYDLASLEYEAELRKVIAVRKAHPVRSYKRFCRDTAQGEVG